MRAGRACLLLLCLVAFAHPAATQPGESQAAFQSGSEAFAAGDYAAAADWFRAAMDAGRDDAAVRFNLAVSLYRSGDHATAAQQFREVAERFPSMRALATYNRGLALFQLQDMEDAAAAFNSVRREPQADPSLLALAEEMLDRIHGPGQRVTPSRLAYFDVSVGHDSNVVLLDESLMEADRDGSSAYLQAFAWYSAARSEVTGPRFDISGYAVRYPDASEYDQNLARAGSAWRFRPGPWQLEPGVFLSYSMLGSEGFERRIGLMLDMRRDLGPRTTVALRATAEQVDELDDVYAYLAGTRQQVRAALEHRLEEGLLSVSVEAEENRRDDAGVSPQRLRAAIRYRQPLMRHWTMQYGFAYRVSRYDRLAVTRTEDLTELSIAGLRFLQRGWRLAAELRWSENDSSDPLYGYRRTGIELGLHRAF